MDNHRLFCPYPTIFHALNTQYNFFFCGYSLMWTESNFLDFISSLLNVNVIFYGASSFSLNADFYKTNFPVCKIHIPHIWRPNDLLRSKHVKLNLIRQFLWNYVLWGLLLVQKVKKRKSSAFLSSRWGEEPFLSLG